MNQRLDEIQAASAAQFNRRSVSYSRSHILADTADVARALEAISPRQGGTALDVATGGGHTALHLARAGYRVTVGDIAERMLDGACKLLAEEGFSAERLAFPAEDLPFPDGKFDLVTCRVAAHHFSRPAEFVREASRVLAPGGSFLLIDSSVPDDSPDAGSWLNAVEKWRDPSHARLIGRREWVDMVESAGLDPLLSEMSARKQPDIDWYFDVAGTSRENRALVLEAIETAPQAVTEHLRLGREDDRIVWWWPMLTLLARKS